MSDTRGTAKERPENATDKRRGSDRDTEEVVYAHLWCALHHDLEGDLEDNFADDVVMLEPGGVFHGREGVKASRRLLRDAVPDARYEYTSPLTFGENSLYSWRAVSPGGAVAWGVDTFVVRDGRIVCQTAYYVVSSSSIHDGG